MEKNGSRECHIQVRLTFEKLFGLHSSSANILKIKSFSGFFFIRPIWTNFLSYVSRRNSHLKKPVTKIFLGKKGVRLEISKDI